MPSKPTAATNTSVSRRILVFYSSETEPKLLDRYDDALQYLEEIDTEVEVVDVAEERDAAKEFGVVATPTVIVEEGEARHRHIGVVDGLQSVLQGDIYGQSVLHQMGFKKGREVAEQTDMGEVSRESVEQALQKYLDSRGFDIKIESFDSEEREVEGRVVPRADEDSSDAWHDQMEEFLGGFFTEVFQHGVMGAETACHVGEDDRCEFTVKEEE